MIQFNKNTVSTITTEDPYLLKAIHFCKEWISGRKLFSITTSGSTGTPKLIEITSNQMKASAQNTGKALSLGPGTKTLVCLNIDYIAGMMQLVRGMELGWELTVIKPTANPLLEVNTAESFDFTAMVPMQLMEVLENETTQQHVRKLGKILLGGAGLTKVQQSLFGRVTQPLFIGYGMTETVSHVALRSINHTDLGEYTLLNDIEYAQDERGCLSLKGAVTNHEVIQTNDVVELLDDRKFRYLGRSDNSINSGGVKIQLEEVEKKIEEVAEELNITSPFFLWYESDDKLGQRLILILEGELSKSLENHWLAVIKSKVKRYESPKHIYFVKSFEKTPTDKIDKNKTLSISRTIMK